MQVLVSLANFIKININLHKNPPRSLTKVAKGPQTSNPIPTQKKLSADASLHLESKDLRSELAEVSCRRPGEGREKFEKNSRYESRYDVARVRRWRG